jgi:hypothetical protein
MFSSEYTITSWLGGGIGGTLFGKNANELSSIHNPIINLVMPIPPLNKFYWYSLTLT